MARDLTLKQRKFVDAFVLSGNATQAAIEAGYSENTAGSIGWENLKKPQIIAEIERIYKDNVLSAGEVLSRLSDIARTDIGDILTEDGFAFDFEKARALKKTKLIKKIKHTQTTNGEVLTNTVEIEMHDAMRALIELGKYHELFATRVKVEDWRSQAIEDIKAGRIPFEALAEAFDYDLATELFRAAGVPVSLGESQESE